MDKKRLVVLALCLITCLAISSVVWTCQAKKKSIAKGDFVYPPGHYLAGHRIRLGYDVFSMNYQAGRIESNFMGNYLLGELGFPPYGGDDQAYFARLVAEGG